jgi:hypothetical protein
MKSLTAIIKKLRKGEVRLLRRYLKAAGSGDSAQRYKLLLLILRSEQTLSDEEACYALYKEKPHSAFSHLKKRLKDDALDTILMQKREYTFVSAYSQAYLQCLSNLYKAIVLRKRGLTLDAIAYLEEVYELALKYEYYALLHETRALLIEIRGLMQGIKFVEKYSENMAQEAEDLKQIGLAQKYYYTLVNQNKFKAKAKKQFVAQGEVYRKELEAYLPKTSSIAFSILYYTYATYYYIDIARDFKLAQHNVEIFLNLAEKYKDIIIIGQAQLARALLIGILMENGNYQEAKVHNTIVEQNILSVSADMLTILKFKFIIHLRLPDYPTAQASIDQARAHPLFGKNKLMAGHFELYQAYLYYSQGNLKLAGESLRKNNLLAEDREGWFLGMRILELMMYIDEDDFDGLDYGIKSFRQFLQKYKDANNARSKHILKIALAYYRSNSYDEAAEKAKSSLLALHQGKDDLYWEPRSFEVIRFDEWFLKRTSPRFILETDIRDEPVDD